MNTILSSNRLNRKQKKLIIKLVIERNICFITDFKLSELNELESSNNYISLYKDVDNFIIDYKLKQIKK